MSVASLEHSRTLGSLKVLIERAHSSWKLFDFHSSISLMIQIINFHKIKNNKPSSIKFWKILKHKIRVKLTMSF